MSDKMKLSSGSSDKLTFLSNKLELKRNVICRIALSISLSSKVIVETIIANDSDGFEFNKGTIYGPDEIYFKALACHVQNKPADDNFFNIIIRNHIENGINKMYADYIKINSPVTYLISLGN